MNLGRKSKAAAAVLGLFAAGFLYLAWPYITADFEAEADRLAGLLELGAGDTAAELGAGDGRMSVLIARRLGANGHMFSTEIEQRKLDNIASAVAEAGLSNVTLVRAGVRGTNLEPECCRAIYMRRVYHHFTDPAAMNRSLFASVEPGGRVAVIDFEPPGWLFGLGAPKGAPEGRKGHGVSPDAVINEALAAGFTLVERIDDWPRRAFCVVFEKPADSFPVQSSEQEPPQ